jgi:Uma2 family endonuclease
VILMRILDPEFADEVIRERQKQGLDGSDEVWDGVYIVSPLANNPHQFLATRLARILGTVIEDAGKGLVQCGANVSDRTSEDWVENYRVPDVVVALRGTRAVDRGTHWLGGPDFLVEVESPGDETDTKIPFYARISVRELLIVHRDTRQLRLYRHDGTDLAAIEPTDFEGRKWLVSAVVPLAFRRKAARGERPRTEVRRTDGPAGQWVV